MHFAFLSFLDHPQNRQTDHNNNQQPQNKILLYLGLFLWRSIFVTICNEHITTENAQKKGENHFKCFF